MSEKRPARWRSRRWLLPAAAGLWLALFALIAWPSLKASREMDARIAELDRRAEELDDWLAIAARQRPDVDRWAASLDAQFAALVPPEGSLEELYYELTRLAGLVGIDPLRINEIAPPRRGSVRRASASDPQSAALMQMLGLAADQLPSSRVEPKRLKLTFEASYGELSLFLDALPGVRRALELEHLTAKQGVGGVSVEMQLECYVQAP